MLVTRESNGRTICPPPYKGGDGGESAGGESADFAASIHLQQPGVDVAYEARRCVELHASEAEAVFGAGEDAVLLGTGDGYVEQAALLL